MSEIGRHDAPGEDSSSWADETLPLGLRRELLDRELRKFIADKQRAQATPERGESRRPEPERPAAGKRRSERPA
jgi:hypothetical protein